MFRASIRGSYDRRLHSSVIQNLDPKALSGGAKVKDKQQMNVGTELGASDSVHFEPIAEGLPRWGQCSS